MASVSGKAFAKALERRGWMLLRINGSHHIYGKAGEACGSPFLFTATKP